MSKITFNGLSGPFLTVYRILKLWRISVCVHHFHRADEDPDCHDHPFHFMTIILKGGYWEETQFNNYPKLVRSKWRGAGYIGFRKASYLHRIVHISDGPCWTLCIKFTPFIEREWGFQTREGWVDWRTYLKRKGLTPINKSEDAF